MSKNPPNEGALPNVRGIFRFRYALCPISFSLLRLAPCQKDHLSELFRPGMLRIGQDRRPLDETRLFQLREDISQHLVIKDDDRLRAVNKTELLPQRHSVYMRR